MFTPVLRHVARFAASCALIMGAATNMVHAEGLEEPLPSMAELEALLKELGHHFEAQRGELEEHLREYGKRWEEEQQRFLSETEEIRSLGEKTLDEFGARAHRFMEENEVAIDQRLNEIRESADALGAEWMERLEQWEQGLEESPHRDKAAVETHLIQAKHRPASEIAAELAELVDPDQLAVMNERAIAFRGDPGEFDLVSRAARELDVLETGLESIKLVVSVIAAGGGWPTSHPLPERFEPIRAQMAEATGGATLALLDTATCLTRLDEEIAIHSYLPDAASGTAQQYQLQIRRIEAIRDGAVRIDTLHFQADVFVENAMRPIHLEASPSVKLGQPVLLGSGSIRGAGEALLLVVEIAPAP